MLGGPFDGWDSILLLLLILSNDKSTHSKNNSK